MTSQTAQEIACEEAWEDLKYEGEHQWEVDPRAMFDAGWQAAQADQAERVKDLEKAGADLIRINMERTTENTQLQESESNLKSQWMYYQDLLALNGFTGITDSITKYKQLQLDNQKLRDALENIAFEADLRWIDRTVQEALEHQEKQNDTAQMAQRNKSMG